MTAQTYVSVRIPLLFLLPSSSQQVRSECDPRDTGGIRRVSENTLSIEVFKSCTGDIIELRESLFVTDKQRGKVDPPFQFSLDSSETLDDDAFLADYKMHVLHCDNFGYKTLFLSSTTIDLRKLRLSVEYDAKEST